MKVLRVISILALCTALAAGFAGCGGGGGGGSSDSGSANSPAQSQPAQGGPPPVVTSVGNLGIALVPSDPQEDNAAGGNPTSVLQVVHLFDANGNPLARPTVSSMVYNGVGDLDGAAMTPGGAYGVMVDGANDNLFFFLVQNGRASAFDAPLGVGTYGRDGDSIVITSSGDEAIVSLDDNVHLLLVSGIASGNPKPAAYIMIPDYRDGVVLSADDKVLLARGPGGLTVFAVNPASPAQGPLGGTVSHNFTQTADIPALGTSSAEGQGRDGMAISPADSSRAVIITNGTSSTVQLLTGLPGNPTQSEPVSVNQHVYSVAVGPAPGDLAIVGTDKGLLMFSGVASGTLTQVGPLYAPAYSLNGRNVTLGMITTLGLTLDGKYAVVCDFTNSALLIIPVSAKGFGAPAGILPGISVPWSDEMLVH
ncbi:MAG: hypothetical protein M0Z75_10695 [Nitrospiraceae bacterium]|nr:hypothetical protein [Nitrospiraceae bacterium]